MKKKDVLLISTLRPLSCVLVLKSMAPLDEGASEASIKSACSVALFTSSSASISSSLKYFAEDMEHHMWDANRLYITGCRMVSEHVKHKAQIDV